MNVAATNGGGYLKQSHGFDKDVALKVLPDVFTEDREVPWPTTLTKS